MGLWSGLWPQLLGAGYRLIVGSLTLVSLTPTERLIFHMAVPKVSMRTEKVERVKMSVHFIVSFEYLLV